MKRNLLSVFALIAISSLVTYAQARPKYLEIMPNDTSSMLAEEGGLPSPLTASIPNCKESNPNVPVPNAPHGLFVLYFPGAPMAEEGNRLLLHNPTICGAVFYVVWSESDKGPGANPRYDFSSIERQVAPWVAAGKAVSLVVWAVSDAKELVATPNFVMSKVPTVECPKFGRVPVFWDQQYVDLYKEFIAAVMQKYGSDPRISYIRFGLGNGGETFPACMYALQKEKGMTQGIWKNYVLNMLDYEHSLNPTRQIMVGINTWGQPEDYSLPRDVTARSAKYGFGIGSQGLSSSDIHTYQSGGTCDVDWCHIFEQYAGKIPLELQMFRPSKPDGSGVGSWVDIMPFALKLHAQILEITLSDCMTAYNSNFRGLAQYSAGYKAAFETAANTLGGSGH
jgi:hypothetical protein